MPKRETRKATVKDGERVLQTMAGFLAKLQALVDAGSTEGGKETLCNVLDEVQNGASHRQHAEHLSTLIGGQPLGSSTSRNVNQRSRLEWTTAVMSTLESVWGDVPVAPPIHRHAPSDFAYHNCWVREQKEFCDLCCSRPLSRTSNIPLCVTHEVFGQYLARVSSNDPLPRVDAARNAHRAAERLLATMAAAFPYEGQRGAAFNDSVQACFPTRGWSSQVVISAPKLGTSARVDFVFKGFGSNSVSYPLILREDKNEAGSGGDAYMQVARSYQILVSSLKDDTEPVGRGRDALLKNGVPVFLVNVVGPSLTVSGGYYDGREHIVEPLGPTVPMHQERLGTTWRRDLLARVLYALGEGVEELQRIQRGLSNPHVKITPGLPQIYKLGRGLKSDKVGNLELVSRFKATTSRDRLFKAKWTADPSSKSAKPREVLVKLVAGPYGIQVHRALAKKKHKYAPQLYATSSHDGAPTGYVMELLSPDEWVSVADFRRHRPDEYAGSEGAIKNALNEILTYLERKHYVHAQLSQDNVLLNIGEDGQLQRTEPGGFVMMRVVGFDLAGPEGEVFYPPGWPDDSDNTLTDEGIAAGLPIHAGHDRKLVESWWSR